MKLNPKYGKTPEDLKSLQFKEAKNLIKKDLKRLEKFTSADNPIPIAIIGEYSYPDKPTGIALCMIGKAPAAFKQYNREEVAKNPLGAVGQVYFKGESPDGQKIIQIDLAKGKGKGKTDKLMRGLKKQIPQATYNVVFGEMSEKALDALNDKMDSMPDVDEVIDDAPEDSGQVEADAKNIQKLLDSNLVELSALLPLISTEIFPRLKAKNPKDGDADTVVDTLDLADEWIELYNESTPEVQNSAKNKEALTKVQNIKAKVEPMLSFLGLMGVVPNKSGAEPTPVAASKSISGSVGKGGNNNKEDVKTVQSLLNNFGYGLVVDGDCGKKSIAAITDFQAKHAGIAAPDGLVEVGGTSWKKLSGSGGGGNNPAPVTPVNPAPNNNNPTPVNPAPANGKTLSAAVGKGATNAKADVILVQTALYKHGQNISIDGDCGNKTVAAINAFQVSKSLPQTGVVEPASATWTALQTTPTNPRPEDLEPISGQGATGALGNTVVKKGNFFISLPPGGAGSYPLVMLFAGKGQASNALMPHTPDSYFKEAILVFAASSDNFSPAKTAFDPLLAEKGMTAKSITICGYSLGGQAAFRNYSHATKAVGFIDPTTYYKDLAIIDSKAVFSTFPNMGWNWSAKKPNAPEYLAMHAMRDGAKLAAERGGVGEETKIGHDKYPKYFLAKFKSKLL